MPRPGHRVYWGIRFDKDFVVRQPQHLIPRGNRAKPTDDKAEVKAPFKRLRLRLQVLIWVATLLHCAGHTPASETARVASIIPADEFTEPARQTVARSNNHGSACERVRPALARPPAEISPRSRMQHVHS